MSHDPSEIILICWFGAQETFIIIVINVEKLYICKEPMIRFFFQDYLMNRKFKIFETEILFNIKCIYIYAR